MATTLAFLPGKFQGQRSLAGNSSRGHKESGIAEHAPQITILLKAKSYNFHLPLPCWNSLVAQMIKSLPAMWETRVRSPGGKICWRRKSQPTPVFLPGKSYGWRSLAGYSSEGHKELDMTERLHFLLLLPC